MAQWIDLREHGILLLQRGAPGANKKKQLILRRLKPGTKIPEEAIKYGFQPEGDLYVKDSGLVVLADLRQIFPKAKVVELPESEFTYQPGARVTQLFPALRANQPDSAVKPVAAIDAPLLPWALIPLPRFRKEATILFEDGDMLVSHGDIEHRIDHKADPDIAKREAHRDAVAAAQAARLALPFAVLVDYADLLYFGVATKSHAATRVAQLLSQLGITERLMSGDAGFVRVKNPPYPDLVIERLPLADREAIALSHHEVGPDASGVVDSEIIFTIQEGRLVLSGTAQSGGASSTERAYDPLFANLFTQTLLDRGYDGANVVWPEGEEGQSRKDRRKVEIAAGGAGETSLATIDEGPYAGLVIGISHDALGQIHVALSVSASAAMSSLDQRKGKGISAGLVRLGYSAFDEMLIKDSQGRRYRITLDGVRIEPEIVYARGVEYMTRQEGVAAKMLSVDFERPVVGAHLFGREVARILHDSRGRQVTFAIEPRGNLIYAYHFNESAHELGWECLATTWQHRDPTDRELLNSHSESKTVPFDSEGFLATVNASISASNEDLPEEYRLPELPAGIFSVAHPNPTTYIIQHRDLTLPMSVSLEADGDMWRMVVGAEKSLRTPLDSACSAAASWLANARMNFLRRLHRGLDGCLHIGVPQADFDLLRMALQMVPAGERNGWEGLKLKSKPDLDINRVLVNEIGELRIEIRVKDTGLRYEVFALELDPLATIASFEQEGLFSVGQLVEQIQSDVMWESSVQGHPREPELRRWLGRYLELQVLNYGEQHRDRVPSEWARNLVLSLASRNVDALLDMLGREGSQNPSTDRLFEEIAGSKIGTSTQSRVMAIYAYCGLDAATAKEHQDSGQALARVRAMEEEARNAIVRAENMELTHEGVRMSGRAFVDLAFDEGYDQLMSGDHLALKQYSLFNPDSGKRLPLKEPLVSYARHRITIRDSAGRSSGLARPDAKSNGARGRTPP